MSNIRFGMVKGLELAFVDVLELLLVFRVVSLLVSERFVVYTVKEKQNVTMTKNKSDQMKNRINLEVKEKGSESWF